MSESQERMCAKYGIYMRRLNVLEPRPIEGDFSPKRLSNWMLAYLTLVGACSFLPNLSSLSLSGDFLGSDHGYSFVKTLLEATGSHLRELVVRFRSSNTSSDTIRRYLDLIIEKASSIRLLELDVYHREDARTLPTNILTSLVSVIRELPDLEVLQLPEDWNSSGVFEFLKTFTNLSHLAFSHVYRPWDTPSSSKTRRKVKGGAIENLQTLSLSSYNSWKARDSIALFPENHALERLDLNEYISSDLAHMLLKHFPKLLYLSSDAEKWDSPGAPMDLTRGEGITPLRAYDLVGLHVQGILITTQELNDVLSSWPNLEYLSLTAPDITTLVEIMGEDDPEAIALAEPDGPGLEVLGTISRKQRKIRQLKISIFCNDTSQLPKQVEKFSSTLEILRLENSFYNCRYQPFHICDAAKYIASLGTSDYDLGLQVAFRDVSDFRMVYGDEFGEYAYWHALLCERLERRVLEAQMKETREELEQMKQNQ